MKSSFVPFNISQLKWAIKKKAWLIMTINGPNMPPKHNDMVFWFSVFS